MFRMGFQLVDRVENASSGDDITESVYERYCDVSRRARRPAIFEGRAGQFGRVQLISDSTTNATLTRCRSWKEADLMHLDASTLQGVTQDEETHHAIFLDAQVLRELVGRFAEVPSAAHVTAHMEATSVYSGSDSVRSTSSWGSECSSSASKGSTADMDALPRVIKRWEEPLVALQKQAEVNLSAQEEVKRLGEEERVESARQLRELRDLANCFHDLSISGGAFKRNKLGRVLSKTGIAASYREYSAARVNVSAAIMRRRAKSAIYPSQTAAAGSDPAQMRSAPRIARSQIQFETVQSTQRDVEAWTTEEYMTRNARLHKWNRRKDDEEFGGIEGNDLINQYSNDDIGATFDSDSD